MRIVTWNINSLKARREHVIGFLDAVSPTLLCLQELKLPDSQIDRELFSSRGYHLVTHGQPTYNGVAIASRLPMSDVIVGLRGIEEDHSRVLVATVDGVVFVNLYCPQGQREDSPAFAYKLRFYDHLIEWIANTFDPQQPLVVTGDLNVAPRSCDVFDPFEWANVPTFHPEEHARWQRLLDWGLHDATEDWLEEGAYTFWDYRQRSFDRNLGMRIDHFLVTRPVLECVQGALVHVEERARERASDHAPLELILGR
ncbi:MAG TPA: exodeoxyribonuclease III [Myxococcota bacterium]|nr:exodeoxyribonuclease III [Myxococcota bacterium]